MTLVGETDVVTGLPLGLLAAVGPMADLESVYHLIKEYPFVIDSCRIDDGGVDDDSCAIECGKKRGGADVVVENNNAKIAKVHY